MIDTPAASLVYQKVCKDDKTKYRTLVIQLCDPGRGPRHLDEPLNPERRERTGPLLHKKPLITAGMTVHWRNYRPDVACLV